MMLAVATLPAATVPHRRAYGSELTPGGKWEDASTKSNLDLFMQASSALEDDAMSAVNELFAAFDCSSVYLDVGSNIGVQIRKLYEPHKYPNSEGLTAFSEEFGPISEEYRDGSWRKRRCGVCAIGFEPNPSHASRLDELQRELRETYKVGVLIFKVRTLHTPKTSSLTSFSSACSHSCLMVGSQSAASTSFSTMKFAVDPSSEIEDTGATGAVDMNTSSACNSSACERISSMTTITVPSVDLGQIILRVHELQLQQARQHGGRPSRIFMKMDIEGCAVPSHAIPCGSGRAGLSIIRARLRRSEFSVLPHLLQLNALCHIGRIQIEFHDRFWQGLPKAGEYSVQERTLLEQLLRRKTASKDCPAWLDLVDDESYNHDGAPWPSSMCGRAPTESEQQQTERWLTWAQDCEKYMLKPGLLKEECNPCPCAEYVDGTSSWFRHTYALRKPTGTKV